ncbi:HET-domain-containing protein [Corynespora cassiicola Philippines]|uniref:HET-domain-containing protein n=1 Tax=Corynespora cassiicola Philippines TaxID=1448308 RepID=A0A2T2NF45_CORCC|nr:HET-domain-containing protein [Corynespora cassiicola Philippines]
MRLINTETLEFEEFYDAHIPPYAILSHTWGSNEVTFKDYRKRVTWDREGGDPATQKVLKTCELAKSDNFRYVWVDSCCIDKSSSAELSEAINSMYKWYLGSKICYTYLEDFECHEDHSSGNSSKSWARLKWCRWFTRGWTLQELIAPQSLHFYDRNWKFVGEKKEMRNEISLITGIPCHLLAQSIYPSVYPVARRISWVAHRQTSREEDLAYCLLGLFDVNMPLLYGEGGQKAFTRLQEHIMKDTNDMSIFAWNPSVCLPQGLNSSHMPAT